jgi:threonine/homoserine/homoserine lactone efflux protein
MDLLTLIAMVVVITASGALAPGPLFFATITHGAKSGAKSGLIFSVAHTIVEFSLVMALALGLLTVANEPMIKLIIGVVGGAALLIFGALQIRDALVSKSDFQQGKEGGVSSKNPLIVGLIFTGLNPYFIIWWLTLGTPLILEALAFASIAGVLMMYIAHVWMDYAWLTSIAYLAKKGTSILGTRGYRVLMIIFSLALIYYGLYFLVTSIL